MYRNLLGAFLTAAALFIAMPAYADGDGDGFEPPADCNDSDININPGATEIAGDEVDQNCDNSENCFVDADNDGYRLTSTTMGGDVDCDDSGEAMAFEPTGDCNDSQSSINPGAVEITGDNIDSDCNSTETCFVDADNDNYRTSSTVFSGDIDCLDSGEATSSDPGGDCNDSQSSINPGAIEVTGDNIDQNCNGGETCFIDSDNDGYRITMTFSSMDADCNDANEALASDPTGDCNDSNASISPAAMETPGDEVDQDCTNTEVCYRDTDEDDFRPAMGTVASSDVDCDDLGEASGSEPTGDCNDNDPTFNPDAPEVCDDLADTDCDFATDCADSDCMAFPACAGTTTTTLPPGPSIDNFKCYKVKDVTSPRFEAQDDVSLDDVLSDDAVDVLKPAQICVPADKENSGIIDPDTSLCCYKIKGDKLDPSVTVQIDDTFGQLELEASSTKLLCQPCTMTVVP